jgi:acyl carrier protein
MTELRDIAVRALHRATGLLNDPHRAREVMAGRNVDFDGLDMDSLSLFEVIMELEDRLGIELDANDVAELADLDALLAFLSAQTPADAG